MAPKTSSQAAEIISLPTSLVSRVDATRVARELESMSNFIEQQTHHHDKSNAPRLSIILEELSELNSLDLTKGQERDRLYAFLKELKSDAPTIHMSFAVVPSSLFTSKLITWLRSQIHPLLLLDIGLQPSIAAGCVIRTNSKYFDCSIRQHLLQNKPKLLDLMRGKHA